MVNFAETLAIEGDKTSVSHREYNRQVKKELENHFSELSSFNRDYLARVHEGKLLFVKSIPQLQNEKSRIICELEKNQKLHRRYHQISKENSEDYFVYTNLMHLLLEDIDYELVKRAFSESF